MPPLPPFSLSHGAGPRRDVVGYGGRPPRVEWPGGARVAVSLVVNYEKGSEYSHAAGDARNEGQGELDYRMDDRWRDLGVESTYEYGSRAGVWRMLGLFEEYGVRTTFFAAAAALELNSAVARAITAQGHEPCSHGWRWSEPWLLSGPDEEREHIAVAVASIRRTSSERPVGWYWRYSPSPWTRELRREPDRGYPKLLSIGLHPRWMGQPARVSALREVLEELVAPGDLWIARRDEIARWWIAESDRWAR